MNLHIGDSITIPYKDIIAILPFCIKQGMQSSILLADGRVLYTSISAQTLQKRLETSIIYLNEE